MLGGAGAYLADEVEQASTLGDNTPSRESEAEQPLHAAPRSRPGVVLQHVLCCQQLDVLFHPQHV